jgi:ribosomal protein S27E
MVTVRKFPTKLAVRCGQCQRQNTIEVFLDQVKRLRCSGCGSRDVVVVSRDRLRSWAARRRGR